MNFSEFIQVYQPLIEKEFLTLFPIEKNNRLQEAAHYAFFSGGKRLRPLLLIATLLSFNQDIALSIYPACALECIHTYSLIHDDLPCMDNDDYRRGLLTVHKKYDEATAILSGDLLLTYAFELIVKSPKISAKQKIKLSEVLAKRAGKEGMLQGQMLDILATNQKIALVDLKIIHQKKTAELLIACLEYGAILAKASLAKTKILISCGEQLGLIFQIIDDILDGTESLQKPGSLLSSDLTNQKVTFVSLLGVKKSFKIANDLTKEVISKLTYLKFNCNLLIEFAKWNLNRLN